MRNKRTLQRGLALLLAGGMALSNLGAAPVLAEEYGTATEVTQAAPDGEAATDTTTNGDTDLSEGSESASPTEEKVDSSGSAAEDTPAAESDHEEAPAEEKTDAETPADKAPDTDNEDPTDEEVPAGDADSDDKESANEDTVEDADADYSADVFNVDEINEIATYAADTTKTVADGMTQLLHEDFSNCTDNFGFSSKAAVTNEALVLTNNSTGQTVIKQFDKTVEGQSKVQLSYDWKISLGNQSTKAGIEYRDTYGRLVFVVMGSRSDKGEYKLRYATEGVDSVSSSCGNSNNDPHWQYADLKNNTVYHIDATADFTAGTLQLKITDSDGAEVVNVANASITAHNLAKMVSCSYYCGASATQTVDNFQLYGSNNAGEFPLAGKTIVAFGDSIVAGHKYTAASFVNFVAEKEGMTVLQKNAVNGATIMDANYSGGRILTQIQNDPNWKPHTNILITGNYINQGASAYACNGIYLCGVKDSVVEKNLLEHIGTCGIELFFADNVAIQYNEVFDVRHKGGGQDSNAIDPDWRATNILIQYNYVHDCGEGLLLCGMKFNSGIIRYNLIQDCLYSYVHYSMGGGYFQFSNNVFYRSKDGNGTSNFDPWGGGTASYVNNVFYDGKGTGFGFSGGTSFSYKNNAYYGTPACWKDSSPIMLSEDPFVGTAPSMSRLGNAATGALLEANGLMPKTGSALVAAGASTDATGTALTDGLFAKGSRFNFTSLAKAYGSIVPMAATAYPVFDATDSNATLNTSYTHTAASTTAPTIGLFEVSMPEDAVYLRGTVSDDVSPCSNAKITVTVNGKTVETTTNASGTYTITEGLTAGEATVTAVVEGRDTLTKTITLAGGKVNILDIAVPMPAMPNAYSDTLISEAFDENAGALAFNTKATVADGRLALSPGNAASSYADFAAEIQSRTAVDFSFDFKYQNGTNKGGFQFRDSDGRLLFAMCVKTADGGNTMRTPAAASLVGGTQMAEPKWVDHTADTNKTYVVRVHADFEAGTVS